jgi:four helix bundle protein
MIKTFEDLDAWKKARELVNGIYGITRAGELARDFGLCGQIQRAAVSVMSNIAEGFERQHAAEKLQAYNIARGSCGEVRSLLYVVEDNYPNTVSAVQRSRCTVVETGSLVTGLINSTRKRIAVKAGAVMALLCIGLVPISYLLSSISF